MTLRASVAAAACLLSCAAFSAPLPCSVTFYGDSILHGMGAGADRLEETPAQYLKRIRPAFDIEDLSAAGASAIVFAPALSVVTARGSIVVVQYGINDIHRGSPETYGNALSAIVSRQRALGKTVIVTGLSRGRYESRAAFDAAARTVAKRTKSIFADWGATPYDDGSTLDGTHAALAYSHRLVDRLAVHLDKVAPHCAR